MFSAITPAPLSVEQLTVALERASQPHGEGCGAVCTFVGVVRASHKGRAVRYLDYEAFEPLAVKTFDQIAAEAAEHFGGVQVAIQHRVGRLDIGEASVVIAAAAAHRDAAFKACRFAIERVKQIAPVWKHEFFTDGDAWVEGATADPADAGARRLALERACA